MKKTIKKFSCAVLVGSCLIMPVGCSQQSADNSKQETENQVQVATGFETTSEYAKVSAPSRVGGDSGVIVEERDLQGEINATKSSAITEDQAFIFDLIISKEGMSKDEILSGKMTVEKSDEIQGYEVDSWIELGELPSNAK